MWNPAVGGSSSRKTASATAASLTSPRRFWTLLFFLCTNSAMARTLQRRGSRCCSCQ